MAFLQARIGSTRLPGKAMLRIRGQSILERAVRRLWAANVVDEVAVLTTLRPEDDIIVAEAETLGVLVHRGPELDVLARFYEAARRFQPDIIVRATADNPLIDIDSPERIVTALASRDLDFCMETGLPYGAATEAVTARALEKAHKCATSPLHREHVTLYIKECPEAFRCAYLIAPEPTRFPHIRVTVDTPEDFYFVEALIHKLPETAEPLPLKHYLPFALGLLREREGKEPAAI
jgi:spore coat polysaccharide biosynthesis protein SpsF